MASEFQPVEVYNGLDMACTQVHVLVSNAVMLEVVGPLGGEILCKVLRSFRKILRRN